MRRSNPAARAQAQRRVRIRMVKDVDPRDVGIRPGVAKALGLASEDIEGPPEHSAETCMTFGCSVCLAAASGGEW